MAQDRGKEQPEQARVPAQCRGNWPRLFGRSLADHGALTCFFCAADRQQEVGSLKAAWRLRLKESQELNIVIVRSP